MIISRRWVIACLFAVAVTSSGTLRGGEISSLVPVPPGLPRERVVAPADVIFPPPIVPDSEAQVRAPAGGLSPGDRNQLVSALVLDIRAERILDRDKADDRIRAEIKPRARRLFASFREPPLPIPPNRDIILDAEQDEEVEGLLTVAFEAAGPDPERPLPHPTIAIEPFVPILFRLARNHDVTALKEDDTLTDAARKDGLVALIRRRMGEFLDLDPMALSEPLRYRAAMIADEVIAGEPTPSLPSRKSRLTLETLMTLLEALKSRSQHIAVEGSSGMTLGHKRQLDEFGRAKARELAHLRDDLRPAEASEVEGLVNQARSPGRFGVSYTQEPDASPTDAALKRRIPTSLRQINDAMASVGFDSETRKSVPTNLVRERFATAAGRAEDLAEEILRGTTTPSRSMAPGPAVLLTPQVTITSIQIIIIPRRPISRHSRKTR